MAMSKQSIITLLLVLGALVLLGGVTYQVKENNRVKNSDATKTLGTEAEAQYQTLSGEAATLDDFSDQIRIVNSWASWSPYSKTELPVLEQLAELYAEEDVAVIAINRNEDAARAQYYLSTVGELPHVHVLIDPVDAFYDRIDGKAMPETLIFDSKGNIVSHIRGELKYEQVVSIIEGLLK